MGAASGCLVIAWRAHGNPTIIVAGRLAPTAERRVSELRISNGRRAMGTQPDILTVGEFEAVVLREFGFLQREYGFRHTADEQLPLATFPRVRFPIADEPTAQLDYRVTSVTFESAAVGVEVLNDPRGEIECVLWLGTDSPTTSVSL